MFKSPGFLSALFLVASLASASTRPQEAQKLDAKDAVDTTKNSNPVKPTAESRAQGKRIYTYDCAMCHGVNGDGKGDLAADMKLKLRDYRDPSSLKDMSDADLFKVITQGKGDMPKEGDRAKPEDVWNMVNYIRSFANTSSTAAAATPAADSGATTPKP